MALVRPNWVWNTWYWVELELAGAAVKARIYAEADAAPAWQLVATTTVTGSGAFGPGSLPLNGRSPTVDIRRLEYAPLAAVAPAAAADASWSLGQTAGPA